MNQRRSSARRAAEVVRGGDCALGGQRARGPPAPHAPRPQEDTVPPACSRLLHRQVPPTVKCTATNKPALNCLFLFLWWKKECNHSLGRRDPFGGSFRAGRGLVWPLPSDEGQ